MHINKPNVPSHPQASTVVHYQPRTLTHILLMYWHYIVGVNWNWSVHKHQYQYTLLLACRTHWVLAMVCGGQTLQWGLGCCRASLFHRTERNQRSLYPSSTTIQAAGGFTVVSVDQNSSALIKPLERWTKHSKATKDDGIYMSTGMHHFNNGVFAVWVPKADYCVGLNSSKLKIWLCATCIGWFTVFYLLASIWTYIFILYNTFLVFYVSHTVLYNYCSH